MTYHRPYPTNRRQWKLAKTSQISLTKLHLQIIIYNVAAILFGVGLKCPLIDKWDANWCTLALVTILLLSTIIVKGRHNSSWCWYAGVFVTTDGCYMSLMDRSRTVHIAGLYTAFAITYTSDLAFLLCLVFLLFYNQFYVLEMTHLLIVNLSCAHVNVTIV